MRLNRCPTYWTPRQVFIHYSTKAALAETDVITGSEKHSFLVEYTNTALNSLVVCLLGAGDHGIGRLAASRSRSASCLPTGGKHLNHLADRPRPPINLLGHAEQPPDGMQKELDDTGDGVHLREDETEDSVRQRNAVRHYYVQKIADQRLSGYSANDEEGEDKDGEEDERENWIIPTDELKNPHREGGDVQ